MLFMPPVGVYGVKIEKPLQRGKRSTSEKKFPKKKIERGIKMAQGKPREPIDLIIAKGKKHLTKAEKIERKAAEIDVPFTSIAPPKYLTKKADIEKFNYYAKMLLDIGILTELDADCLARYIIAEGLYLKYTKVLTKLIEAENINAMRETQTMQDKVFKQCQACARELGLTISARCKLVIPRVDDDDDEL